MSKEIKLQIVGENKMTCSGCERSVKSVLAAMDGVQAVDASHETQLVEVAVTDDALSPEQLQAELATIDYKAVVVEN